MKKRVPVLVVLAAAILIWEIAGHGSMENVIPPPERVAMTAIRMVADGTFLRDALSSLLRVVGGYAIAVSAGIALGSLSALTGAWGDGIRAMFNLLRPIPPIAWVPLAILWFGLGNQSALFIVFIGAFFPIFMHVAAALGHCPHRYLELAQSLRAPSWMALAYIRIPAAAPAIASGLRAGLGLAWTSVIAAELVGAQSGLGYRIQMHRLMLETDAVIASMLFIGLLGFGMDLLARLLELRLIRWRV